jgi:hypothetical protein
LGFEIALQDVASLVIVVKLTLALPLQQAMQLVSLVLHLAIMPCTANTSASCGIPLRDTAAIRGVLATRVIILVHKLGFGQSGHLPSLILDGFILDDGTGPPNEEFFLLFRLQISYRIPAMKEKLMYVLGVKSSVVRILKSLD